MPRSVEALAGELVVITEMTRKKGKEASDSCLGLVGMVRGRILKTEWALKENGGESGRAVRTEQGPCWDLAHQLDGG